MISTTRSTAQLPVNVNLGGGSVTTSASNVGGSYNNYYSYQALYNANVRANYYNAQIDYSMRNHARAMEDIYRRIRGDR